MNVNRLNSIEELLNQQAEFFSHKIDSLAFAICMDKIDPLAKFQDKFHIPTVSDVLEGVGIDKNALKNNTESDDTAIYFNGNSLGLQSKLSEEYLNSEMEKWAKWGSIGYFKSRSQNDLMWSRSEDHLKEGCADLIGAKKDDVACLNSVTVNLHLLFISFYRPTKERFMILMEDKAFPSDFYAVESQIRLKGYDPKHTLICLKPREGEHCLRNDDIIENIKNLGNKIALVFLSSVHYYTGALLDMETITTAGKIMGCYVGWNLTHGIGNVKMNINDWNVDFAIWSSYKYLNGGPGCIAGMYVNEKYKHNDFPKLLGWFGHKYETRFIMNNVFDPEPSPDIYKISNSPALYVSLLRASLKIFQEATMDKIVEKSYLLTGYLYYLLKTSSFYKKYFEIITPEDPSKRGNQLSILFNSFLDVKMIYKELTNNGVVQHLGVSQYAMDEVKFNVFRNDWNNFDFIFPNN
ncbi:kynureninase-like isoform X2 [Gordionus sp. m RMFG-2023]|uniref:kynureninase-like isoform X2 n=1 Tax=Gordionus sp. m RMFG-2023 TaxID=3053472 RepID=UPI0031FDA677